MENVERNIVLGHNEYISRHMETMELLKIPDFYKECIEGVKEIKKGRGEKLSELES